MCADVMKNWKGVIVYVGEMKFFVKFEIHVLKIRYISVFSLCLIAGVLWSLIQLIDKGFEGSF